MKTQSLENIAKLADGELIGDFDSTTEINNVSIDTRTINPGDLYVPIIGENLDGHDFMEEAFTKGAVASLVDKDHLDLFTHLNKPQILVEDTLVGLQTMAKDYRDSLDLTVIGITGSNGKTTTKDIIYSVLDQKMQAQKTIGNLNNEIGLPRTLLSLEEDTDVAILEMGMEKFGDVSLLVKLARPQIAAITNIGYSHLHIVKTRENVAKAKLEILEQMTADDLFIYNYDDDILRSEVAQLDMVPQVVTFGTNPEADHVLTLLTSNAGGTTFAMDGKEWTINLLGHFQMYNAAVAVLIGQKLGLSDEEIQRGLFVEDQTKMRAELVHLAGFDILNDAYKSNPQALEEALTTVGMLAGYKSKIAILGDMLELGEDEAELHRESGRKINPNDIDYVLFFGDLSRYMMEGALENFPPSRLFHFNTKLDLIDKAKYLIDKNSLVLVKASRSMKLEEVIEAIQAVTLV